MRNLRPLPRRCFVHETDFSNSSDQIGETGVPTGEGGVPTGEGGVPTGEGGVLIGVMPTAGVEVTVGVAVAVAVADGVAVVVAVGIAVAIVVGAGVGLVALKRNGLSTTRIGMTTVPLLNWARITKICPLTKLPVRVNGTSSLRPPRTLSANAPPVPVFVAVPVRR